MKIPKNIKRGDLVSVTWLDFTTSATGDVDKPDLAPSETPGYYYGVQTIRGIECLVCAVTHHPNWSDAVFTGNHVYPIMLVGRVEKLR